MAYQCFSDKPLLTLFSSSLWVQSVLKVNAVGVAVSLKNYCFGLVLCTYFWALVSYKAHFRVYQHKFCQTKCLGFSVSMQAQLKCCTYFENLRIPFRNISITIDFFGIVVIYAQAMSVLPHSRLRGRSLDPKSNSLYMRKQCMRAHTYGLRRVSPHDPIF